MMTRQRPHRAPHASSSPPPGGCPLWPSAPDCPSVRARSAMSGARTDRSDRGAPEIGQSRKWLSSDQGTRSRRLSVARLEAAGRDYRVGSSTGSRSGPASRLGVVGHDRDSGSRRLFDVRQRSRVRRFCRRTKGIRAIRGPAGPEVAATTGRLGPATLSRGSALRSARRCRATGGCVRRRRWRPARRRRRSGARLAASRPVARLPGRRGSRLPDDR